MTTMTPHPHPHPLYYLFPLNFPHPIFLFWEQKISRTPHGQASCSSGCKRTSEWSWREDESLYNCTIYTLPPPISS